MTLLTRSTTRPGARSRPGVRSRTAAAASSVAVLALLALAGCSNISGLGGSAEFGCKAPVGVPCMSVSGVNANERAGNLPSQRAAAAAGAGAGAGQGDAAVPLRTPQRLQQGSGLMPVSDGSAAGFTPPLGALRSDPTVIRIWIPPWEDADGDLVDQTYVYLQIDSGRWLIEHNREAIKRAFAPRALTAAAASPPALNSTSPAAVGQAKPSGNSSTASSLAQIPASTASTTGSVK